MALQAIALSPTGRVILGMLALGRNTGYDIKQMVDKATRHFWAVSYGQLYPELRRLEHQGLVRGHSEPTGGRTRPRLSRVTNHVEPAIPIGFPATYATMIPSVTGEAYACAKKWPLTAIPALASANSGTIA